MNPDSQHRGLRDRSLSLLRDGTAGAGTRLMASLVAGLLLTAISCVSCYILGSWFPPSYRPPVPSGASRTMVYVSESVAAVVFLFAGIAFMAVLFWIWSRHRRKRVIWLGGAMTVGIAIVAVLLCILVDIWFTGDEEFLISGVIFAAIGLTLAGWTRLYHRYVGGRALYDESGMLALQCPECGYSMVGLKEARCPECGKEYTLNDLLARQDFEALRVGMALSRSPARSES